MEQAVRKALKGLLLRDLQDIVLEYLPDRGTLVFPACWLADNGEPVKISSGPVLAVAGSGRYIVQTRTLLGQRLGPENFFSGRITFDRKEEHFEPFHLDFTPYLPLDRTKTCRATVIYQGDPCIVEINC
jgi:hypothetical protein